MRYEAKQCLQFTLATFIISFVIAGVFWVSDQKLQSTSGVVVSILYMFVPMIVAMLLQKSYGESLKDLGISFKFNRWFIIAWLFPIAVGFSVFGISLLFPSISFSPEMAGMFERYKDLLTPEQFQEMQQQIENSPFHPIWLAIIQGLIAGATINAVAGFGEEYGWRGFLQTKLQFLGFWKSSYLIGIIWGLWHAPLILQGHNYPQHPFVGVLMMTAWTTLFAPLIGYIRYKARSVIAPAIMHGTINGTIGIAIILIQGGNDITSGVTGIPGLVFLFLCNIFLWIYERKFNPAKEL